MAEPIAVISVMLQDADGFTTNRLWQVNRQFAEALADQLGEPHRVSQATADAQERLKAHFNTDPGVVVLEANHG